MRELWQNLVPQPLRVRPSGERVPWDRLQEHTEIVRDLGPEGYRLNIDDAAIRIEATGPRGVFIARQTVQQLRLLSPATCPCLEIEDEPVLRVRGYMLDISRCKVPTMDHLYQLVDLLALLKYNQLQLYTEHTFAYVGHDVVWRDASPMTPEEIRGLSDYCSERFIELVPNQNAFGHMDRWLRHDAYQHLAESPFGYEHPILGHQLYGSVLHPDGTALEFVDGLLEQLLPCFSSDWVHLGCDEPWELGQGRSIERATAEGRHVLYKEHLLGLHHLCQKRDKRMLFWSDELRDDPNRIKELPRDMIPVVWGYERDHIFDDECHVYASADRRFLLAPGDSSWNSHGARLDNAFPNIRRAGLAAQKFGAAGMLLTSWGDNGHHQVWPAHLGGLLIFAASSWNPESVDQLDLADALNRLVFMEEAGNLGQFWHDFGQLDTHIPVQINPANTSFTHDALRAHMKDLNAALRGCDSDCLFPAFDWVSDCRKILGRANPASADADWLMAESQLALDMAIAGLNRAEAVLKGRDPSIAFMDWAKTLVQFRHCWSLRNRPGGLQESIQPLQDLL